MVLVAAGLQAGVARPQAALLAAGAGVFALGDASVALFAGAALAVVGVVRLVRLQGRDRITLARALVVSGLLVVLAGGPISDALFQRGGTTGLVRVAWDPVAGDVWPFQQAGPALIHIGIIPLTAIGAAVGLQAAKLGPGIPHGCRRLRPIGSRATASAGNI